MKNKIFKFLVAAIIVILFLQVAGASVNYTCYIDNVTGMDDATDEELINAILGITPEPPEILLRGKQAPSADTWTKSNLIYTLDGNSCRVTKYTGNATDLLVPVYTEIDGVSYHTVIVSPANNGTFADNTNLVSVQFGNTTDTDSITFSINTNAPGFFRNDSNIESVSFFAVNTSQTFNLGKSFENCTVLYNVDFQPGMRINGASGAFANTKNPNLTVDLSDVVFTAGDMSSMFTNSSVSEVVMPSSQFPCTSLNNAFSKCNNLQSIDLSNADLTNCTSMYYAFYNCSNLTSIVLPNAPSTKIVDLRDTFANCNNITYLNVSGIDVSNATYIEATFEGMSNVTEIDVSTWNTSKARSMYNLFSNCYNLTTVDVSGFDTSNVTSFKGFINNCSRLQSIDVSNFNTTNVNSTEFMFNNSGIHTVDLSGFNTTNLKNMSRMFSDCKNLTSLDLSGFDLPMVDNMSWLCYNDTNLTYVNMSVTNTTNLKSTANMFRLCKNLTTIDLSLQTENVTNMAYMFQNCGITSVDLSSLNTSNVTDFANMFELSNITSANISTFDLSSATTMSAMFRNCTYLTHIDLPTSDSPNLKYCQDMFHGTSNITELIVTLNTTNVTTIHSMFANMTNLTSIDVSAMNTSNVTVMQYSFRNCRNLTSLNLSTFDTSNVTFYDYFISDMPKLEYLDISSFNLSAARVGRLATDITSIKIIHTPQVPNGSSFSPNFYFYVQNASISQYANTQAFIDNGTMTRAFNTTVVNPAGATISVQPHAAWNTSVPLSATLSDGYIISSWNVTDQNGNSIEVTNDSFTMPFANVTVRANTERPQFTVTVIQPSAGATISASSSVAYYNSTINLSSNVQTGYVFNSWNVTDENGTAVTVTGNSFRMPMSNVTVTANIDHPLYNLTVVQPSAGGTIAASSQTAYYGDTINLTSDIQTGYRFNSWNVTTAGGQTVSVTNNSFTMPASDVNIRANITHVVYSVGVIQPTGATISASPGSGFYGDTVTLTSTPQTGYRFLGWNVTTAGGQTVTVTGNTFTLPADNVTVRANVEHIQYTLTVIPTTGITVTAPATAYYLNAVTLNKTVSTGYRFLSWNVTTAGGQSVSVSGDSFTMPPDNVTIQALGEKIVYNITELQPEGGSVLANRSNATYGDQVSLTSVPSTGYRFVSWNVTADGVPVTVTGNTFSMPAANVTVSAVYEKIVYDVTVVTNTAGTITTNRSTATYGDLVSVSASPVIGYNFESWNVTTDGGQQVSVTNDSFVMPAANVSVAAVFSSATYTVTVAQTTGGNTTVSQSAANPGTVIWITAEPDSGYIITNYAVISEGGDSIFVENSAFAMPASNVTASVTYSVIQPQFTTTPGISFTPTNIVLNYTSNARSNDYPEFIWEASADNFTTIDNSGTVSGINGSIAFSSNRTSGNLTIRMRPVVGTEWTSITISLSTEVIINIVDGVDGTLISTGSRFTSVGGLVTPSAAVVNAVLNNSTMMITTSGGNTTRMRTWSTTINASAGENLTFTYTGGLDSPWANVTYVVTIPSTNMLNITLPRQESGYAGTVVYYTDGGQPVAGIPVAVYDSSYNDLGTITTYAGGQAVYQTDDFAAVYFDVNTSGYTTNTKVVPIPSHDSVYLSKTRTITIRVMDATGGQFVPAFTTYLGDQEVMKSTDNGSVVYSNVEDGTYSVIVSASGFYQVTREITVDEQNTDFVLNITQQNSTTFTSQNFVRLIYTDIFGNKMPGLTIRVTENNTEVFTGVTGADGSVSMIMNQTRLYQITATNSQGTVVNTLSLWPQYSEYAIIVKSSASEAPPIETAQLDIYWKTDLVSINASTSRLNLSMKNANENQNVTFTATLKNNTTALNFTSGIIEYGTTTTVNFTVPNANETYLLEVTYTDENGNSRTVTSTIQTNLNEMKMKYEIPGFSEQWHYDALCVLLILVTSFLFSQQTKHIGGIIIPLEAAGLYAIGWLRYSGFAICMLVAVVIMALILFVERMDRD